jgi:hypothetical protein
MVQYKFIIIELDKTYIIHFKTKTAQTIEMNVRRNDKYMNLSNNVKFLGIHINDKSELDNTS